MVERALVGADLFDGTRLWKNKAVVFADDQPVVVHEDNLPDNCMRINLNGGTLMPGFVDLQVNGGGGIMFNVAPTLDGLRIIVAAHARLGTRGLLPTLITDTPAKTTAAIAATKAAIGAGMHGILGLHLEGPHLSAARKGAHDATLIRQMTDSDCRELLHAAEDLPNLMVTVAPENVTCAQITALSDAGVIVFLGHSDADYETTLAAFAAGAKGATHLFNAMSPLTSRAPGVVGATLNCATAFAGLIADGIHVHPATIRTALAANAGPGDVFLVTDAMAAVGSDISSFELGGRTILRQSGRLTLADGTLAGADLEMAQALRVMIEDVGEAPENAYRRATSIPSSVLRTPGTAGAWPKNIADLIYLASDYSVKAASDLM